MYIHGSFLSLRGETVTVKILTRQDYSEEIEIGGEDSPLHFTDEPCEIASEMNDTFDVLLPHSATIRLLSRNYIADFFCASCRDAVVNVYKADKCVFAGYIEPQSYSQGYNELYDEVELSCIDALSALQYSKYKDIGSAGVSYAYVKTEAGSRTFLEIMREMLEGVTADLAIGGGSVRFLHDCSKSVGDGAAAGVFGDLSVSELLFLGDEEDDVWQQDEVLAEMLRFLNLHIVQDGFDFYIFDWATVKGSETISWAGIDGVADVEATGRGTVEVTVDKVADNSTQISVGEVYNQLLLTCTMEEIENVIESPLDDDYLTSPYDTKQLYMIEYSSDGEGKKATDAFFAMTHGENTDYGEGQITRWYLRVLQNTMWKFPWSGGDDLIADMSSEKKNQQAIANWLSANHGAALLSMGSVEINTAKDDNSPTSSVDMKNMLVLSVNGDGSDDEATADVLAADIEANIPYAEYAGSGAGGNYSPSDEETTNYIVVSGKIVLNPIMEMTNTYAKLNAAKQFFYLSGVDFDGSEGVLSIETVPSRNNGDGRYYTRQYWKAENSKDEPEYDTATQDGFCPYTGEGPEELEFKYSAIGESTDTVSKVAVMACMLVIGDKVVVESGTQGQPSDFTWQTYKTLEECADEDEYYQQCFTIGFDPKIGDKLIGAEFEMQNNIDYTMGLDTEGIAIPIRKTDKVSGKVTFKILGPVNTVWNEVTRRHPTFFRHTKWSENSVPLLSHVSSVIVEDFEVKVYSDNGLSENVGEEADDIVYMSDTEESYVNKKDDLEMKINSALTAAECRKLGVSSTVSLSTALDAEGDGVTEICDALQGVKAKAEQLYVDAYYTEWHTPHVEMEQNFIDDGGIGMFDHCTHPAMGKEFFIEGMSRDLREGSVKVRMKEV